MRPFQYHDDELLSSSAYSISMPPCYQCQRLMQRDSDLDWKVLLLHHSRQRIFLAIRKLIEAFVILLSARILSSLNLEAFNVRCELFPVFYPLSGWLIVVQRFDANVVLLASRGMSITTSRRISIRLIKNWRHTRFHSLMNAAAFSLKAEKSLTTKSSFNSLWCLFGMFMVWIPWDDYNPKKKIFLYFRVQQRRR